MCGAGGVRAGPDCIRRGSVFLPAGWAMLPEVTRTLTGTQAESLGQLPFGRADFWGM